MCFGPAVIVSYNVGVIQSGQGFNLSDHLPMLRLTRHLSKSFAGDDDLLDSINGLIDKRVGEIDASEASTAKQTDPDVNVRMLPSVLAQKR